MDSALITSPAGVLAVLAGVTTLFFWLKNITGWKLFTYVPPLIFIYTSPIFLSNLGLIPTKSATYSFMSSTILPCIIVLLLVGLDVKAAFKIMGKGVAVMLTGTVGMVLGAPIGFFIVKGWLGPEAWKGFGALAGSFIGGTGNMAAIAEGIGTPGPEFGLAIIADNVVSLIWLPLLLWSKNLAPWFNKFADVDPERVAKMEAAAEEYQKDPKLSNDV